MSRVLIAFVFIMLPSSALAGFPTDIVIDNLSRMQGCDLCGFEQVDVPALQKQYYEAVAQDLMVLASPHVTSPAETTGLYGFDFGVEYTLLAPRSNFQHRANGLLATGWEAMAENGEPSTTLMAPGFSVRKGLPWSFEVEGAYRYLVGSRQSLAMFRGKWAFQEGTPPIPDIAVGVGYGAYIGNPQLDLGATQFDIVAGWTVPVGINSKYNGARWSPWIGYGWSIGHAKAKRNSVGLASPNLSGWFGRGSDDINNNDFQFHKMLLGMRIVAGSFQFSVSTDLVLEQGRRRPTNTGASTVTMRAGMLF